MLVRLNTILLISITILLFCILIVLIVIASKSGSKLPSSSPVYIPFPMGNIQQPNSSYPSNDKSISPQSDFFKRSMTHAEEVIKGNISLNGFLQGNGKEIILLFMLLNDAEKKKLLQTINYFQSDPLIYADTENEFRRVSIQSKLPIWLVILSEAMKKNNLNSPKVSESPLRIISA